MSRSALTVPILTGILQDIVVACKTAQTFAFDLFLFSADPASSTLTDHAAFVLHANDIGKVADVITFQTTDWVAGNTASVARLRGLVSQYTTVGGNLYAAIVVRATPTLGSTSDLSVTLKAMQD
jgi:hypothetical protein